MNKTIATVFATSSTLLLCSLTFAVEYQFAGSVTSVPSAFSSQFSPGDIVRGRMTLSPPSPSSTSSDAFHAVSDFSANIGGDYPITSNVGDFKIHDNFGGLFDIIALGIYPRTLVAPTISGHVPEYFTFNLLYDQSALSSTDLLDQFIVASHSDQFPFLPLDRSGLRFDGNDSLSVAFQLHDLSVVVPEPNMPSDLTNNGFVDLDDLAILLANWDQDVGAALGNFVSPDDTPINFDDLAVLLTEWTGPDSAGSPEAALGVEAVPEPSSLLLAVIATLGLSFYRRRRQRAFQAPLIPNVF